ncbi:hypothetical protein TSAR_008003, partial [Trichomalopsis sarcophagae]
ENKFRTLFSHRTPHSRKLQISESAFPTPIYQISKMQPLLPQGDFTANFTGLLSVRESLPCARSRMRAIAAKFKLL